MLQSNPLEESAGILASRHAFLYADEDAPVFEEELPFDERHRIAEECVGRLRRQFWSLEKSQLVAKLEELDVADFPDLAVGVGRMKSAFERWEAFERLEEHPHCFPEFLDGFKRLVIAALRTAADIRREELEISRGASQSVYRSAREYTRIAQVVERDFPELFVLEEDWLTQIAGKESRIAFPRNTGYIIAYALIAVAVYVFLPRYFPGFLLGMAIALSFKLLFAELRKKS